MKKVVIGIDWGGTYIKAGIVSPSGRIIKRISFSSLRFFIKEAFIKRIESLFTYFSDYRIVAVGIGVPGLINLEEGYIYYLPNIKGWEMFPIREILQKRLEVPVCVDNDANVFALAELKVGVAKGIEKAIFLTLGTGIGGAVAVEGKILHAKSSANELGHIPISLGGKRCGCGAKGCIETFVGGKYLLKEYNSLIKDRGICYEVKEVYQRALKGEKEAIQVWKSFSYRLGRFLSGMVNLFNPEMIVLGGGIAGAYSLFKPWLWETITSQVMWPNREGLKLRRAKLKSAGIVGAGLLAWEEVSR